MKPPAQSIGQAYSTALESYLEAPTAGGLAQAYVLGRHALDQEQGIQELVAAHSKSLCEVLPRLLEPGERERSLQRATDFFREAIAPTETVLRSYQKANSTLQELNLSLEQRVIERTAALRESERRFRRFMQKLEGLAWIKDCSGKYVYVNDAAAKAFSAPEDHILGSTDDELFAPEFARQFQENDQRALASESGILTTETLRHPDGILHHSLVSKFPITNADGQIEFIGGMAIDITDRVRAEEALRAREERWRSLTNTVPAIVWTAAADGTITFASDRWYAYTGLSPNSNPREWFSKVLHPEDHGNYLEKWATSLREGTDYEVEARIRRHDGAYRWWMTRATPIRDNSGKVIEWFGSSSDIDAQKRAAAELRESEARFRHLIHALPAAIYTTDQGGRITMFNEAAAELWGRRPELGKQRWCGSWRMYFPDGTLLPPEKHPTARALHERQSVPGHELIIERPDGSRASVIPHPVLLRDGAGNLVGAVTIMADVTDRKRVEEALRESEEWFHQLADAMPQITWAARPDGSPEYFNLRWYQVSGLPPGSLDKACWQAILHPDDVHVYESLWSLAIKKGNPFQMEARFKVQATANYRWHLCRAVPMRDRTGRIIRWYGTCTDIEQQKRTEEALVDADRRKDEFLAILSHELRNPLAPIRNALHILRLGELQDPDLNDAREIIERQVQLLSSIVNDLLDVFRIIHGKLRLEREPLDLARLVRQTFEDHQGNLEDARLTLTLDIPTQPVWVTADRRRLCQILTNLLSNARKFSNPGDQVTVSVAVDEAKGRASVTVRDTGIGIPGDLLPHVFDTFVQLEQSMDRRRGGLGLGLPLVRGLVELHGGGIRAFSEGQGKGTEVSLWLPLGQAGGTETEPQSAPPVGGRKLRILIVEDNVDAARSLSKLLVRFGHEVTVTHTGPAAIQAAYQWKPNVALCDLGLPEMDGFEVARVLRSNPSTNSARLIAVSGYGQPEDQRRSLDAGFDLHLTKPVDPVELQQLLAVIAVEE